MEFNTIFNNISVIWWQSVLLVEETTDLPQVTDKIYHIMQVFQGLGLTKIFIENKGFTNLRV
jgi:hypothetical protein